MMSSFVSRTFNIRLFLEDQRDKFSTAALSEMSPTTMAPATYLTMTVAEWVGVQSCVNRGYSGGRRTALQGSGPA